VKLPRATLNREDRHQGQRAEKQYAQVLFEKLLANRCSELAKLVTVDKTQVSRTLIINGLSLPDEINPWPAAPAELRLVGHEIHVWASSLSVSSDVLTGLTATLSPLEKEHAGKFKFDLHRNRFIAGRGLLRTILGRYLQISPSKLDFAYSPQGKPALDLKSGGAGLHFNLAHTEDLALFVVTRVGPVGVDVESIRPVKEMSDLVARFFSQRENELFQKLPTSTKPRAFFNLWIRKEALLKAAGEGIMCSLNLVEVSFLPDEPARVLAISGDSEKAASWSLHALSPAPGFVGAVAIQARNTSLRCWNSNDVGRLPVG
jgi:4'-phosphopantetheinyl transferase